MTRPQTRRASGLAPAQWWTVSLTVPAALEQLLILSAIVFGPLTSWLASRRDRQPAVWFVFGALLGPIATLLVLIAPRGRCPACDAPVRGWPATCRVCGTSLPGAIAAPAAVVPAPPVERAPPTFVVVAGGPGRPEPPATAPPATAMPATAPPVTAPLATAPPVTAPLATAPPVTAPQAREARPAPGPASMSASPARPAARDEAVILATGTFAGGSTSMGIGYRYAIGRRENELQILGPLDLTPDVIAVTRPLRDLEVTLAADKLLITGSRPRDPSFVVAFWQVGMRRGLDIERELAPHTPVEPPPAVEPTPPTPPPRTWRKAKPT